MAAIDKYYTYSYQEFKAFCDWAKDKEFITPRGCKIKVINYVYTYWEENDFVDDNGNPYQRPILNTPTYVDNYLWHNCPFQFIKDWLKESYSGEGYCKGNFDEINRTLSLPEYTPCTKVKILRKGLGNCPYRYHRSGLSYKVGGWDIFIDDLWYNENIDQWILPYEIDQFTCNCASTKKSIKSIIRKIIYKWKIPKNCRIHIRGCLVSDDWILITK